MKSLLFLLLISVCFSCSKQAPLAANKSEPASLGKKSNALSYLNVAPNNSNIQYVGRWDTTNTANYHSYWNAAYFRVKFTGTMVKIKLAAKTNICVIIDGGAPVSYLNAQDTVDIAPQSLSTGTHTLTVAARYRDDEIQLTGLFFEQGATISTGKTVNQYLEYIGDSITSGQATPNASISAYPWLITPLLSPLYDHTQISYNGIPLSDGYKYGYNNAPATGMIKQYFQLKQPNNPLTDLWGFNGRKPKAVIINLGTNDSMLHVPTSTFINNYKNFVSLIHQKLPDTKIIIIQPIYKNAYAPALQAMVKQSTTLKLYYIDTKDWLLASDFDTDGIHPNGAGHLKIAQKLAPLIPPILTLNDTSYYKIVNQNSGYVLDVNQSSLVNGAAVIQYSWYGGTNQQWQIASSGNQYFKIINRNSGKVIDISQSSLQSGASAIQYTYTGSNNQQWQLTLLSDGTYKISNRNSGQSLDVYGSSTTAATKCIQATASSSSSQRWRIEKL